MEFIQKFRSDAEEKAKEYLKLKWTQVILNSIVILMASGILGFSLFNRIDLEFGEWIEKSDHWKPFWISIHLVLGSFILIILSNLLSIYGAIYQDGFLMQLSNFLLTLSILLELLPSYAIFHWDPVWTGIGLVFIIIGFCQLILSWKILSFFSDVFDKFKTQ